MFQAATDLVNFMSVMMVTSTCAHWLFATVHAFDALILTFPNQEDWQTLYASLTGNTFRWKLSVYPAVTGLFKSSTLRGHIPFSHSSPSVTEEKGEAHLLYKEKMSFPMLLAERRRNKLKKREVPLPSEELAILLACLLPAKPAGFETRLKKPVSSRFGIVFKCCSPILQIPHPISSIGDGHCVWLGDQYFGTQVHITLQIQPSVSFT